MMNLWFLVNRKTRENLMFHSNVAVHLEEIPRFGESLNLNSFCKRSQDRTCVAVPIHLKENINTILCLERACGCVNRDTIVFYSNLSGKVNFRNSYKSIAFLPLIGYLSKLMLLHELQ